ncbi:MAG: hypothetical protein ACOC0R_01385 [Mariniphaga sp.]
MERMNAMKKTTLILMLLFVGTISILAQNKAVEFNLDDYTPQSGLTAEVTDEVLTITWNGDNENEVRMQFRITNGTPVIHEMAVKKRHSNWQILTDITPEFRVVSGLRRVTQQQIEPLKEMGVPITEDLLNEIKWDAFWDARFTSHKSHPGHMLHPYPVPNPFLTIRECQEIRKKSPGHRQCMMFLVA